MKSNPDLPKISINPRYFSMLDRQIANCLIANRITPFLPFPKVLIDFPKDSS